MAGLFGLFDVTREGPGVDKNAPKKRSFVVFFEILGRKFWNLMLAGVLFAAVNLPLITRGWADAGLTFITRAFSREKHAFVKEDFFDTIRKNRGQAFLCGFINFLITGLLFFNITYYMFGMNPALYEIFGIDTTGAQPLVPGLLDYVIIGCTFAGYVIFTFMKYYIPFLVITFDLPTKQVYRNAMIFSMAGLKENLLISAVLILLYGTLITLLAVLNYAIVYLLVTIIWLFALPAFRSYLIQFTIFPVVRRLMIDPYYEKNPDADKQQRLDLNLEVEKSVEASEDTQVVEEPLFVDGTQGVPATNTIPRQYSERELRRFNDRRTQTTSDDDDTI